jgi:hypothetical protein
MALSTIANLRSQLGIGSRPNLFEIEFHWPSALSQSAPSSILDQSLYLCKAAAIPAFTIGVIEVPYRGGRRIKVPGDRSFGDWTATFISDDVHALRGAFKAWLDYIELNDFNDEALRPSGGEGFDYLADLTVKHLKQNSDISRYYKLFDCFPTDVSAIDLSFDSTDTLSEFTVTFQYHTMTASSASTPDSETQVDSASAVSLAT